MNSPKETKFEILHELMLSSTKPQSYCWANSKSTPKPTIVISFEEKSSFYILVHLVRLVLAFPITSSSIKDSLIVTFSCRWLSLEMNSIRRFNDSELNLVWEI
jgi:hypothetical protein